MPNSAVKDIMIEEAVVEDAIDLLDRQTVIERILKLLDVLSIKKASWTMALNGAWGTGKSFVLNRLMNQLMEYEDGNKYIVFHYNCWQYDYYEEPLIAILAAMQDSIDEKTHIFSQELRENVKKGFAIAKPILANAAKTLIEQKIGIDISKIVSLLKELFLLSPR